MATTMTITTAMAIASAAIAIPIAAMSIAMGHYRRPDPGILYHLRDWWGQSGCLNLPIPHSRN